MLLHCYISQASLLQQWCCTTIHCSRTIVHFKWWNPNVGIWIQVLSSTMWQLSIHLNPDYNQPPEVPVAFSASFLQIHNLSDHKFPHGNLRGSFLTHFVIMDFLSNVEGDWIASSFSLREVQTCIFIYVANWNSGRQLQNLVPHVTVCYTSEQSTPGCSHPGSSLTSHNRIWI